MARKNKEPQDSPLSEAKRRAVELVAMGASHRAIASALGVTEFTVSRWRKTSAFEAAVDDLRRDSLAKTREALVELGRRAIATLTDVMESPSSSTEQKLKAAGIALDKLAPAYTALRDLVEGEAQNEPQKIEITRRIVYPDQRPGISDSTIQEISDLLGA